MRLRHPDGPAAVAYCSNVHPADDLDGVAAQLSRYAARVRERLGVNRLGVGLWVAAPALADADAADRLAGEVRRLGLEVVTLNGFPYRAFHAPVVKRDVYSPSWADPARAEYTLALASCSPACFPTTSEGSISTVPLGWRVGWGARGSRADALEGVADGLAGSTRTRASASGSRSSEPAARSRRCRRRRVPLRLAPEWIGLCLDACHLAAVRGSRGRARPLPRASSS